MKKIVLFAMGLVMSMTAIAQDEIETTISGDIVSRYIWRGQDLGDVSLQPTLGIGYKGFSLTAWGNVGLTNSEDTKEFDLTLAYTTGGFNIGITDPTVVISRLTSRSSWLRSTGLPPQVSSPSPRLSTTTGRQGSLSPTSR